MGWIASVAARTRVHGCDEHKVGGIDGFLVGARDGDKLVFERLTESFEDATGELGDFVEKEDAEVGERDFTRFGFGATANDGGGGGSVVRRTEGASRDDAVGFASDGVDFGDGDLFFGGWRREEISGGTSEEGFAGTRRAGDEDIVVAGDSDGEGTFDEGLSADVVENGDVFACFGIFYSSLRRVSDELLAFEMEEELIKIFDTDEVDVREKRSLGEIF